MLREQPRVLVSSAVDYAEEDCACPDSGTRTKPVGMHVGAFWQATPNLLRVPLPDQHHLLFDPSGHSQIVVINNAAQRLLDMYSTPRPLDALLIDGASSQDVYALRRLSEAGVIRAVDAPPDPPALDPYTLTAWLHVTNNCNLRCTYCYIHKTDESMDLATGLAAIDAIFRSALAQGFRAVKLKYAGGEATLRFDLLIALHQHAQALAAHHGLGLTEVVLSNGVALTQRMAEWLRDEGVRLMISLDGIAAAHDAQRTFLNGRGSSTSVLRALDRAVAIGVSVSVSITITSRNAADLASVVGLALDYDLPFNLNFYRENSLSASFTDLRAEDAQLVAGLRAAFAVIEARLPQRRLIDGLLDRSSFQQPHDHACGAGYSYLVVDPHGGIARCQMHIDQVVTNVFATDPLQVIRLDTSGFHNVPTHEKEGCRTCPWQLFCAGGCPALTFRATGRTDIRSPYCNVYTAVYADVLRLEGLRMLKWGDTFNPLASPTDMVLPLSVASA